MYSCFSICTLISAVAELNVARHKSDTMCRLQGSLIQVPCLNYNVLSLVVIVYTFIQIFGVGSVLFEVVLSIETAISVSEVRNSHSSGPPSNVSFKTRLVLYNLFVFSYGIVAAIISNINDYYEHEEVTG